MSDVWCDNESKITHKKCGFGNNIYVIQEYFKTNAIIKTYRETALTVDSSINAKSAIEGI